MDNDRIINLKEQFQKIYGREVEKIVVSPGRAEIIGGHTDYNHGYALAAAIENTIVFLSAKRSDNKIQASSTSFNNKITNFPLSKDIAPDKENCWSNYLRGVVSELLKQDFNLESCDILIDSNVPLSCGVSSSAALELGMAYTVLPENTIEESIQFRAKIAYICKLAENNYANVPCGFLDQGAVALGDANKLVFLDFMPKGDLPVSEVAQIPADLAGYEFIISVEPSLKHDLGSSGYPARRHKCEESLPLWSELLKKNVSCLREITIADFNKHKDYFEGKDPIMRKRIEHVIFENERVLQARRALEISDIKTFGRLLSESGRSALELYGLDEKTPELTFLLYESFKQKGVIGSRGMGGGFSALILSLVEKSEVGNFKRSLSSSYQEKFGLPLQFIKFNASKGVHILRE